MQFPRFARHVSFTTAISFCCGLSTLAQAPGGTPGEGGRPPFDVLAGPGPGMGGQEIKVQKRFDKDGDKMLNAAERKAAREFLEKERASRGGQRGFGGPGGFGGRGGRMGGPPGSGQEQQPAQPGKKVSIADVKSFPGASLYDPGTLRTFFLEFESADWEKELSDFNDTDVDVPAKLTVDGKTYADVGVRFRGMSSLMGVPEGRKKSLNIEVDFVHKDQDVGGYRTLNLLNAHEDPTFLRPVLFYQIAREYLPAPKANFARVVINGENWGIYNNVQQFNKDFIKEWFDTTKGARWKVRGSPGGGGSLAYLGDDPEAYKRIYTIKTKDEPKAWSDLIKMCKVLNETPPDKLEAALSPLLDIDGALKFIALDIALINNDGYWIRTSDYSIYQDVKGQFHVFPQDANETFAKPGGPGFGGPGGRGFGPGMLLAPQMLSQADQNADQKLSKAEFTALADTWFGKLDTDNSGKLTQEQFAERFGDLLQMPQGFGPPGGGRGFGPGRFVGPALFTAADRDKDGSVTRQEFKAAFEGWASEWDSDKSGTLDEQKLRTGLAAALPQPNFMGRGGRGGGPGGGPDQGPGGRGGRGGRGGFGGPGFVNMGPVDGVKLDPLIAANDPNKPLISKLLAVPTLRARYLGYVRDIADKWLDWKTLGPIAQRYHTLIADDVRADTKKLDSIDSFEKGLTQDSQGEGFGPFGRGAMGLKGFADQRREYLLNYKPAAAK